MCLCY